MTGWRPPPLSPELRFVTSPVVFFVIFLASTTILGLPFSWVFSNLNPLELGRRALAVDVYPTIPVTLGELITVTVKDAATNEPVDKASVSVMKDGSQIVVLMTDQKGQARFEYPGLTTVIVISKVLYTTSTKVIPRIPDHWILSLYVAFGAAAVGGFLAFFRPRVFSKKRRKERKRT